MAWTVQDQCDPDALTAWNAYAEDSCEATLAALLPHLIEDFPSFCALLLKIKPKGGGYTAPFLFNQVQRRIWREICKLIAERKPLWFVILKFRQAGMSTFWCAWLFWQMWRQTDIQTMTVAHQLTTAETMIQTMKVFYDELPDVFKPELREGNHGASIPRGEIYFADRRSWGIIHLSKNVDPRGGQPTHVLETEYSSFDKPTELNAALLPALPTFGSEARLRSSFIIESTPKGANAFHDLCKKAAKGQGVYHYMFFPWFLFDDQYSAEAPETFRMTAEEKAEQKRLTKLRMAYSVEDGGGVPVTRNQMYWRRMTIDGDFEGDEDMFKQEMPSDDVTCWLLGSRSVFKDFTQYLLECVEEAADIAAEKWAGTVIGGKAVATRGPVRGRLVTDIDNTKTFTPIHEVRFEPHPHGPWLVWEPPVQGHKYSCGGDPALGLNDSDPSVICVLDATTGRQVAEFCDQMGPEKFAVEMAAGGYWYNQALLVPEINSIGYVLLKRLLGNIMYPNMFRWPKWDEVNRYTHKRGWETNTRTKQIAVSAMTTHLDNRMVRIASRELLDEMSTFEAEDCGDFWSFEAQKGSHDDRVMAFGLALSGVEQTPQLNMELNRQARKIPTTTELHLAASAADVPTPPLPKKIQELITIQHAMPWNPFGSDIGVA
jgi:hypothetical protein